MFAKNLTKLSNGGTRTSHKGKGSQQAPMPDRSQITQLSRGPMNTMNDYAKATPMAQPSDPSEGGFE